MKLNTLSTTWNAALLRRDPLYPVPSHGAYDEPWRHLQAGGQAKVIDSARRP